MKHIKPRLHAIAFGMILAGLFAAQPTRADQSSVSFNDEVLISDGELSSQSGQGIKDPVISSDARLSNNVITVNPGSSVTNGNNIVSDQAFANSNGISAVIQNSGNNVIIQNSTVVNMTLQ